MDNNPLPNVLLVASRNATKMVTVLFYSVPDGEAEEVIMEYCKKHGLRQRWSTRCSSVDIEINPT